MVARGVGSGVCAAYRHRHRFCSALLDVAFAEQPNSNYADVLFANVGADSQLVLVRVCQLPGPRHAITVRQEVERNYSCRTHRLHWRNADRAAASALHFPLRLRLAARARAHSHTASTTACLLPAASRLLIFQLLIARSPLFASLQSYSAGQQLLLASAAGTSQRLSGGSSCDMFVHCAVCTRRGAARRKCANE